MMMVLEKNNRVELQPTIQTLFDMIHKVSRELIIAISCVPRFAQRLSTRPQVEVFPIANAVIDAVLGASSTAMN